MLLVHIEPNIRDDETSVITEITHTVVISHKNTQNKMNRKAKQNTESGEPETGVSTRATILKPPFFTGSRFILFFLTW